MAIDITALTAAVERLKTGSDRATALMQKIYDEVVALRDAGGASQADLDALTNTIESEASDLINASDATDDDPTTGTQA